MNTSNLCGGLTREPLMGDGIGPGRIPNAAWRTKPEPAPEPETPATPIGIKIVPLQVLAEKMTGLRFRNADFRIGNRREIIMVDSETDRLDTIGRLPVDLDDVAVDFWTTITTYVGPPALIAGVKELLEQRDKLDRAIAAAVDA